jgi:hypothetical protein
VLLEKTPKLIVTCRSTSVEYCEHEIGNVIYPRDPGVEVRESPFKGVLFIYTTLTPDKAYAVSSHREYGFVENIIPIYCALSYPLRVEDLAACFSKLPLPRRIKLKVRIRGLRGFSEELFSLAVKMLKSMNIDHDSKANTCLYFEGFNNVIYVGLGDCQSVFKASIKSR